MDKTDVVEQQTVAALKARWKQGRNGFQSFFAMILNLQEKLGPEGLREFCSSELGIGLSIIHKTAEMLEAVDAQATKEKLRPAVDAEKARKKAARTEQQAKREIKRLRRRNAQLEHELAVARTEAAAHAPDKTPGIHWFRWLGRPHPAADTRVVVEDALEARRQEVRRLLRHDPPLAVREIARRVGCSPQTVINIRDK